MLSLEFPIGNDLALMAPARGPIHFVSYGLFKSAPTFHATLSHRATVAPTAVMPSTSPSWRPAAPGDQTETGTYSREWSVEASVGSFPWSAVRISKSSDFNWSRSRPSVLSNSSRHLANPTASL